MLLSQINEIEETISMFLEYGDSCQIINNHKAQIVFQIKCHCETIKSIKECIDEELPYGVSSELTFEDYTFEVTIIE